MGSVAARWAAWEERGGRVQTTGGPASTGLDDPQSLHVELFIDEQWVDITAYAIRDPVAISRGRSAEDGQVDRSTCDLTLNNRDGRFSPRNPVGLYYGKIGRNTPLRVSRQQGDIVRFRFTGEVSEWPQRADISGRDVYVPVQASGIMRRLSQGASPLRSTMYRALTTTSNAPVEYWPCEDADKSTSLASATSGPALTTKFATPDFAAFSTFACSSPLPTLQDSEWTAYVRSYAVTGQTQLRFLLAVPSAGATDGQAILQLKTSGTASSWSLHYGTGGTLRLEATNRAGGVILTSGAVAHGLNGALVYVSLELTQDGANIDWTMASLEVGRTVATSTSGTLNSRTVGQVDRVSVNFNAGLGNDTAVGHISLQTAVTDLEDMAGAIAAHAGEAAARRMQRLCAEEGIACWVIGDPDDTAEMGAQTPMTLLDLVREAVDADLGLLYEPRDGLGLSYRTRVSLYNQTPLLALSHAGNELAAPLDPTDDDRYTHNDITVSRTGGSSSTAVLESGALSILPPPDGVGHYDDAPPAINVHRDAHLPDQANWRLHLGTVDEARYPRIALNLRHPTFDDDAMAGAALALDVGDRLTVEDLPSWLPPDAVTQITLGYRETIGNFQHDIDVVASSESPYQVAVYGTGHYDSDGSSVLAEDLDTTETAVEVSTPTGRPWTTDSSDMPFDIGVGGERMTVTAISGATSPQTFTVTRSVNGVAKTHDTGDAVALWQPAVIAL